MKDYVLSLARHGLTTVGGSLIAKGLLTASTLDEVVGAIITIVGVIWSIVSKSVLKKIHIEEVAKALETIPPLKKK